VSQASMEFQRALDEMRRAEKRTAKQDKGRRMNGDQVKDQEKLGMEPDYPAQPAEAPSAPEPQEQEQVSTVAEGAEQMAKTKTATKRKAAKKPAKKSTRKSAAAKAAPVAKVKFDKMPAASELELEDVRTVASNRYVNLVFKNGYVLRLFPVGFKPADVDKATALTIAVLKKHLR